MPRSGTTLVEQIISKHNSVYGTGELFDLEILINQNFDLKHKIKFTYLLLEHHLQFRLVFLHVALILYEH